MYGSNIHVFVLAVKQQLSRVGTENHCYDKVTILHDDTNVFLNQDACWLRCGTGKRIQAGLFEAAIIDGHGAKGIRAEG